MKKRKLITSVIALLLAALMVLGLFVGILPGVVSADNLTSDKLEQLEQEQEEWEAELQKLKEEQEKYQGRLQELGDDLKENWSSMEEVAAQRAAVDEQVGLLYMQINNLEIQIQSYNQLIAAKQQELEDAEANLAELNAKYKERIRAMEESGDISFWSVLFKASSFMDLLDRMNMVEEIAAADQKRLKQLEEAAAEVESARNELELSKAELEDTKAELEASKALLEEKQAQAQVLMAKLVDEAGYLHQMVEDFEAKESAVGEDIRLTQKEIDRIREEAEEELERLKEEERKRKEEEERKKQEALQQAGNGGSAGGGSTGGSTGGNSGPVSNAYWMVPCDYILLTSPWGYRWHPIHGDWRMHHGVDLAGRSGTPILATRSGVVSLATYDHYGYGYYVEIDHGDGFSSLYAHMTHFIVRPGQVVSQGQVIGYMGTTGGSTGVHLHFGVYYNNKSVNPMEYIG